MLNFVLPGEGSEFLLLLLTLLLGHQNLSEPAFKLSEPVRTSTKELRMAERKTLLGKSQAEPDFLHFNDLACEAVGGKVSPLISSRAVKLMVSANYPVLLFYFRLFQ